MRRRDLIKGIAGSAIGWPLAALAQQPAIPVIGYLSFRSANESASVEAAFRQGLSEIGYSDGRSVHIAFCWAEGQRERLPALAADLVDNVRVAVIASTGGAPPALAAKAATKTIRQARSKVRSSCVVVTSGERRCHVPARLPNK